MRAFFRLAGGFDRHTRDRGEPHEVPEHLRRARRLRHLFRRSWLEQRRQGRHERSERRGWRGRGQGRDRQDTARPPGPARAGLRVSGGDGGEGGVDGEGGMGGSGPDPCDPLAPEDGCAINDPDGIYVAPTGDDTYSGEKDAPLETAHRGNRSSSPTPARPFTSATARSTSTSRFSDDGLVLRGGFECPSPSTTGWLYQAGIRARVRPSTPGYALRVSTIDGLVMSDIDPLHATRRNRARAASRFSLRLRKT